MKDKATPSEKIETDRYEYKKVKITLECKLTEAELKASAKALAESLRKNAALESQLETFKSQIKAQITQEEGTISEHTNRLNSEKEFRLVDCEITFDYQKGIKTTIRKDTGEQIREEKITDEERQMHLGDPATDLR
ncbi:MAG TPA: hypothetical protein VIJ14_01355 [Rhabdochlamydiaceae bacterium]